MRPARALLVVAFAFTAVAAPTGPSATSDPSIEADVFARINASRSSRLVQHSGLLSVARQHSAYMSRRGGMSHDNADSRIRNAPPDPVETNGAPDDGSPPASWCENVTYVMYVTSDKVAGRIYGQWEGSGAHGRCMRDTKRNVGAVGVHYDGEAWWATFIAMVDNTPPGGAAPKASSAPTREEPAPRASQQPAPRSEEPAPSASAGTPTDTGTSAAPSAAPDEDAATPDRSVPDPDEDLRPAPIEAKDIAGAPAISVKTITEPAIASTTLMKAGGYGWQELISVIVLLALATLLLKRQPRSHGRRKHRRPERPVTPPKQAAEAEPREIERERELVGAGTAAR